MAGFLDAVIQEGPYKGLLMRECIALGLPPIDASTDHAEARRFLEARLAMKDAAGVRKRLLKPSDVSPCVPVPPAPA